MGFYLRKSISVGPVRFNLSGSGVGVSAGGRGLRVGSGPRGNYVHMGSSGLYYRATMPRAAHSEGGAWPASPVSPSTPDSPPLIPPGTHDSLQNIESASASDIVDSSSATLLREINEKRRRRPLWPIALIATCAATFVATVTSMPGWLVVALLVTGVLGVLLTHQRDVLSRTVVLFYGMEPDMEKAYGVLHSWAAQLAACSNAWHIEAQGQVLDRKYHAGAGSLVRRNNTFIRKAAPADIKTNVETVALGVGRQVLHFFPDRVLVYDPHGVGAVGYSQLHITATQRRFIEDGSVPPDAKVVDHTWKYVNKNGGPDRRFRDNRQLPICLYDELSLQSASGLNEVVQVSRCDVAEGFAQAVRYLGGTLPSEVSSTPV